MTSIKPVQRFQRWLHYSWTASYEWPTKGSFPVALSSIVSQHKLKINCCTDCLWAFLKTLRAPGWPQAKVFTLTGYAASTYTPIFRESNCWLVLTNLKFCAWLPHAWFNLAIPHRSVGIAVCGMYLPYFLRYHRKWRGLISGQRDHVFPELFSIMSKHTSFCGHFICSQRPHQGLGLSSKQWAQESHSLLYKKSGTHLDSCISLSRHTRHVSGITHWNNAVLIAIRVTLGRITNTEQRREFLHCLRGFEG